MVNIAKEIAGQIEQPVTTVKAVLDGLVSVVQEELKTTRKVRVNGLAIFTVKFRPKRPARTGRNPATGEDVEIEAKPPSNKLAIRPVKDLRDLVAEMKVVKK